VLSTERRSASVIFVSCRRRRCACEHAATPARRVVRPTWTRVERAAPGPAGDSAVRCRAARLPRGRSGRAPAGAPRRRSRAPRRRDAPGRMRAGSTGTSVRAPPCWPCSRPPPQHTVGRSVSPPPAARPRRHCPPRPAPTLASLSSPVSSSPPPPPPQCPTCGDQRRPSHTQRYPVASTPAGILCNRDKVRTRAYMNRHVILRTKMTQHIFM